MKIIQANKFYFLRGGAERYMFDVSDWLESHGHEVIPFAMKHPDNFPSEYNEYFPSYVHTSSVSFGFEGLRTVGRMLYSIEARRNMATVVAHTKPDLCHVHNIYTQISPSILHALKEQGVPVVMTVHDHHLVTPQYNIWVSGYGEDHRNIGMFKGAAKKFHKNSAAASFMQVLTYKFHRKLKMYQDHVDLFITPSDYLRRQLIAGGFDAKRIRVNHYGAETSDITPNYSNKGYILFVGRLSEEKGIETVIKIAKEIEDVQFKIVGKGPDEQRMHLLAHGMPNVEFLGFRDGAELTQLYRNAMAVVIPSRVQDVFPLVMLEAMRVGTPVIASHAGGIPEVIQDRHTGLLVTPTDLSSWVESVLRVAFDDDLRDQLSRNARHSVETMFSKTAHFQRLEKLYEEAIRISKTR